VGSGLLTKQLAKKVPREKVYAVDIDSNMIKQARNNLQLFDNVEIIQASFTDIRLPQSWMSFFLILLCSSLVTRSQKSLSNFLGNAKSNA
jgi:16S rRNA A1518/A1519 N6-dimethyltransferase RsmA/KsgA/DIM1 with predicted DNA glycosylase/AP lyase activity